MALMAVYGAGVGTFMPYFQKLTDDEYIRRIRRSQRIRPLAGALHLFAACTLAGLAVWVWKSANPERFAAVNPAERTIYEIGVIWGMVWASAVLAGLQMALTGIGFLLRDRGSLLLIQYYERLKAMDDVHAP